MIHIAQCGFAKATAGREKRERFENVGFSGAVATDQHNRFYAYFQLETRVVAEILDPEMRDGKGMIR